MSFLNSLSNMPYGTATWVGVVLLGVIALYLSREPARDAILSLTRLIHGAMRIASRSILKADIRLAERNREVLLAAGRDDAERIIEREFERIEVAVRKDLSECPSLQRRMNEQISKIEDDHKTSTDVPPAPPGWMDAVEAVANIPSKGDPMVANILDKIHDSLVEAHENVKNEYRAATKTRHEHLKAMRPNWRLLQQHVTGMDKNVMSLLQRAKTIDGHMDKYDNIVKGTDQAVRTLSSSSLTQFFISLIVLIIAVGGALINFNLIARPMSEMVGGNQMIGTFRISDIAALVIIMVETSMGLFLMESLRITRLFPVIAALPDKKRTWMIWITLSLLLSLASVEAGLAYMREILLQDELATSASLRGDVGMLTATQFSWITTAAQMAMGFILPIALVFVAIPLENFVQSGRTVLGLAVSGSMRGFATLLRVFGNAFFHIGALLVSLYDFLICVPLWMERRVKQMNGSTRKGAKAAIR
jgi:hypothetical protein